MQTFSVPCRPWLTGGVYDGWCWSSAPRVASVVTVVIGLNLLLSLLPSVNVEILQKSLRKSLRKVPSQSPFEKSLRKVPSVAARTPRAACPTAPSAPPRPPRRERRGWVAPAPADPVRPRTATAAAERHVAPPGRHPPKIALTYIKHQFCIQRLCDSVGARGCLGW